MTNPDNTDPAHAALTGLDYAHHMPAPADYVQNLDRGPWADASRNGKPKPRKMPSGWWVIPGMIFGAYIFGLVLPCAFLFIARLF